MSECKKTAALSRPSASRRNRKPQGARSMAYGWKAAQLARQVPEPDTLSQEEVAEMMDCTVADLQRLEDEGVFPIPRVGRGDGSARYRRSRVESYIDGRWHPSLFD